MAQLSATHTAPLMPDELQRLNVLRGVDIPSIWGMLEQCPLQLLSKGEQLFHEGQLNTTIYMILDGQLSVHLNTVDEDAVARINAGETVGEISVIDDRPVTAHVLAAEPSRLIAVDEDCFWRLTQVSHSFATNMLFLLARRMRRNNFTITESMQLRDKLKRAAIIDGLTNIFNRRWLNETLPRLIQRLRYDGSVLSLIMADIDNFKRLNDTYGHVVGDQVLVSVAHTISARLRPTDFVVRYGGEEFAVILPDTRAPGSVIVAERLCKSIDEATVQVDGKPLPHVTISLGAATLRDGENASDLLERADKALYCAKNSGRNRAKGEADL